MADMTIGEFLLVCKDIKRRLPHLPDDRVEHVPMILDAVASSTADETDYSEGALSSEDQGVALEVVENMERAILRSLMHDSRSGAQLIAASIEEYESTLTEENEEEALDGALMGFYAAAEIAIQRLVNFGQIRPRCKVVDITHAEFELIQ